MVASADSTAGSAACWVALDAALEATAVGCKAWGLAAAEESAAVAGASGLELMPELPGAVRGVASAGVESSEVV